MIVYIKPHRHSTNQYVFMAMTVGVCVLLVLVGWMISVGAMVTDSIGDAKTQAQCASKEARQTLQQVRTPLSPTQVKDALIPAIAAAAQRQRAIESVANIMKKDLEHPSVK